MKTTFLAVLPLCAVLLASAAAAAPAVTAVTADRTPQPRPGAHANGEHPAVLVQRLARNAGYDYASKFYPHPAWLYLREVPQDATALARSALPEPAPTLRR